MKSSSDLLDKTIQGDVRELIKEFPDSFIDLVVTSPPYFRLRSYTENIDPREIGREHDVEDYIKNLTSVFMMIKPKVKPSGSIWVNIDDTYRMGSPMLVPERFVMKMVELGFKLHNKVIWYKPDPQSESSNVTDHRFSRKYEVFYWFTLTREYYFDGDATHIPARLNTVQRMEYNFNDSKQLQTSRMRGMVGNMAHKISDTLEGGVDCGDVWIVPTNKDKVPHKAPYPQLLIARPIIACCPESGVVFDPFMGSGRTAIASNRLARHSVGTELNPEYAKLANEELAKELGAYGQSIFLEDHIRDETYRKGMDWFAGKDEQMDLFGEETKGDTLPIAMVVDPATDSRRSGGMAEVPTQASNPSAIISGHGGQNKGAN